MIYKITGDTGKGRAACGCLVKAGEDYFIETEGKALLSKCSKHVRNRKSYKLIRVPRDLVDGRLEIR